MNFLNPNYLFQALSSMAWFVWLAKWECVSSSQLLCTSPQRWMKPLGHLGRVPRGRANCGANRPKGQHRRHPKGHPIHCLPTTFPPAVRWLRPHCTPHPYGCRTSIPYGTPYWHISNPPRGGFGQPPLRDETWVKPPPPSLPLPPQSG